MSVPPPLLSDSQFPQFESTLIAERIIVAPSLESKPLVQILYASFGTASSKKISAFPPLSSSIKVKLMPVTSVQLANALVAASWPTDVREVISTVRALSLPTLNFIPSPSLMYPFPTQKSLFNCSAIWS